MSLNLQSTSSEISPVPPEDLKTQEMNTNSVRQLDQKPPAACRVCGSTNTVGYNYGVLCCGACQLFFFQATSKDYLNRKFCNNNNKCEITLQTRKCCITCRLHKCLRLGMDRSYKGKTGPKTVSHITPKILTCAACGEEKEFRSLKQNVSKLCHKCTAFFSQIKIGKNSIPNLNECISKGNHIGNSPLAGNQDTVIQVGYCFGKNVSSCRYCRFQRCLQEKVNAIKGQNSNINLDTPMASHTPATTTSTTANSITAASTSSAIQNLNHNFDDDTALPTLLNPNLNIGNFVNPIPEINNKIKENELNANANATATAMPKFEIKLENMLTNNTVNTPSLVSTSVAPVNNNTCTSTANTTTSDSNNFDQLKLGPNGELPPAIEAIIKQSLENAKTLNDIPPVIKDFLIKYLSKLTQSNQQQSNINILNPVPTETPSQPQKPQNIEPSIPQVPNQNTNNDNLNTLMLPQNTLLKTETNSSTPILSANCLSRKTSLESISPIVFNTEPNKMRPGRNKPVSPENKWTIECVICSDKFTKTKRYMATAQVNKNYINSCKSCREFYCHIKAGRVSYPAISECFRNKHCQTNIKSCRFCRLQKYLKEIEKQNALIDSGKDVDLGVGLDQKSDDHSNMQSSSKSSSDKENNSPLNLPTEAKRIKLSDNIPNILKSVNTNVSNLVKSNENMNNSNSNNNNNLLLDKLNPNNQPTNLTGLLENLNNMNNQVQNAINQVMKQQEIEQQNKLEKQKEQERQQKILLENITKITQNQDSTAMQTSTAVNNLLSLSQAVPAVTPKLENLGTSSVNVNNTNSNSNTNSNPSTNPVLQNVLNYLEENSNKNSTENQTNLLNLLANSSKTMSANNKNNSETNHESGNDNSINANNPVTHINIKTENSNGMNNVESNNSNNNNNSNDYVSMWMKNLYNNA